MKTLREAGISGAARLGLGVLALAALTGVAFAMWMEHGAGIFMTLVEQGLSWCF